MQWGRGMAVFIVRYCILYWHLLLEGEERQPAAAAVTCTDACDMH